MIRQETGQEKCSRGEVKASRILDCAVNLALLGLKQRFYETIKFSTVL
jgi:hypothetical protein